jgi:hypothetical protein
MPEGVQWTITGGTYVWTVTGGNVTVTGAPSGFIMQPGTIYNHTASTTLQLEPLSYGLTPEQLVELTRVNEEQLRANEERQRLREERATQRHAEADAAETRARELLEALLDEQQLADYRAYEHFTVIGSAGNRYRIRRGTSGNVHWLGDDGEILGRLCAHPSFNEHWLPVPDVAAGQMLALVTNEPAFIGHANVHEGRRPVFEGAPSV